MQWLGSLVFTACLFLWTFVYAIFFVTAGAFTSLHFRNVMARFWAHVLLTLLRWLCRLDYTVEGQENLPRDSGIAFWKHSSTFETIAMAAVFPDQVWILKRELIWIPVVGWGLKQLHAIAIDRGAGSKAVNQVVQQGSERLQEGLWIMVFPEGTRMPPGETRKYGLSTALLASRTGRPVIPVAHDAGYYWPRRGLYKRPGTIRVVIGQPIETLGREPRDINAEVQEWIEGTIRRIREEKARGHEVPVLR